MKNICFFSGDITNSGGTERVASIIANELSKNKEYKISFVSLTEKKKEPFFYINSKIKRHKLYDKPIRGITHILGICYKLKSIVKNENIDILIGTQMVVKGHHFPNVTLVGVIAADSSLNIDDYRANERTFQILTQVAGRAGREQLEGNVIIQTYNPENFAIQCAKEQNYDKFYNTEIALREQLKYPPFSDIILIGFSSLNENEVKQIAEKTYQYFRKMFNTEEFNVLKPMPSPIDKIQNRFRWRIIIKGIMTENANGILNEYLQKFYNCNYKNTKVTIEINPNNMM